MPLSTTELNRVSDDIVASAMTCRAHSAAPGANGTANRIGTAEATLAAASWSDAANGDVMYTVDAALGVLDSSNNQTVTHISVFRGAAFVGSAALTASVVVTAGGTFTVNANTIRINGSTT